MINDAANSNQKGQRVADREIVLRLAKPSKDSLETGRANPEHFALSSEDEKTELQSLSVWVERLTSPLQAREFMGDNKQFYTAALRIHVDQIRLICPGENDPQVGCLDVVWDSLIIRQDGVDMLDDRPGAAGHAGIIGLKRPPGLERAYYKKLRVRLADISKVVPLLDAE